MGKQGFVAVIISYVLLLNRINKVNFAKGSQYVKNFKRLLARRERQNELSEVNLFH